MIVTIVFNAAADFTPKETIKYINHIKAEPNTTVCHPCFNNIGKKSPNESFSITAKPIFPDAEKSHYPHPTLNQKY